MSRGVRMRSDARDPGSGSANLLVRLSRHFLFSLVAALTCCQSEAMAGLAGPTGDGVPSIPRVPAPPHSTSHGTGVDGSSLVVRQDGSVLTRMPVLSRFAPRGDRQPEVRFDFGLPPIRPIRQWREDGEAPVCRTLWETNGIRYTAIVMITNAKLGEERSGGAPTLVVQLIGENFGSEYREACAALAVEVDGRRLQVELVGELVRVTKVDPPDVLAVVQVPSAGTAVGAGERLEFRGDMPPGTSGSMTVKIPLGEVRGEAWIERLRDLEFDDELKRVRREWKEGGPDRLAGFGLRFEEPLGPTSPTGSSP